MSQQAEDAAQQLIQASSHGVLSTFTVVESESYPFGSLVPYAFDDCLRPVLLISRLAKHTRNIGVHPEVSLFILDSAKGKPDVQTLARITLLAKAEQLDDFTIQERYFQSFPQTRPYFEELDFEFYRLQPVKLRYIAGFGKAYWLNIDKVFAPNGSKI